MMKRPAVAVAGTWHPCLASWTPAAAAAAEGTKDQRAMAPRGVRLSGTRFSSQNS